MLTRADDPGLPEAMSRNLAGFWLHYGWGPGGRAAAWPSVAWFVTGLPHPLFNGVPRLAGDPVALSAAHAGLAATLPPGIPALWWLGPEAPAGRSEAALAALGVEASHEVPAMAAEIPEVPPPLPAGLGIETVTTPAARLEWTELLCTAMGFRAELSRAVAELELRLPQSRGHLRFLGRSEGAAVACSQLVLAGGVGGIHAVATVEPARGRGFGAAVTAAAAAEARRRGARIAVLQASAMGFPVYQRLGFREVFRYRLFRQTGAAAAS